MRLGMNGRYSKPDRPVSPKAFPIGEGQQGVKDRSHSPENPNEAQMLSFSSLRDETEQTKEYAKGLYSRGGDGDFSSMAMGQGIGKITYAFNQVIDRINMVPFTRKLWFVMAPLILFSIGFHSGKWWFKEPPEELFTSAQASESIQSNTYRKTEKLGYFLEDCY